MVDDGVYTKNPHLNLIGVGTQGTTLGFGLEADERIVDDPRATHRLLTTHLKVGEELGFSFSVLQESPTSEMGKQMCTLDCHTQQSSADVTS